jgi:hypothetical protein
MPEFPNQKSKITKSILLKRINNSSRYEKKTKIDWVDRLRSKEKNEKKKI